MVLENKLNITDSTELARMEEKISKKKAVELFENGYLNKYKAGSFEILAAIHKYLFGEIYDFALKDQSVNNWSLTATSVWRYTGQNMVLFIGAMMSVDSELYEAASLDGANKWEQFKHIILPSIKTIITLNVILSITGSLSAFEAPFVITTGANGTGTYFVIMNKIAHTSQKVGLASAMSVVLLMIIFICTILQNVFFKYVFRDAASEDESYKAKKARLKAEKQVIKQIKKQEKMKKGAAK